MPDFADIFGAQFGGGSPFGDLFGRRMQRNRDLNIQCQISLFDSYVGKQFEANYSLPSGKNQTVVINIPPGISHGETIRYQGLGDDSVPGIARGSLNVTIVVLPDQNFSRVNDDLYATIHISPIEAMVGCSKKVKQITGQEVSLVLRAGVESGTEFASTNGGFSNPHTGNKGRFVTVVKIRTPAITDPMLVEKLKQIDNEINKKS
jgi:DnaJ-class molecular chaperone